MLALTRHPRRERVTAAVVRMTLAIVAVALIAAAPAQAKPHHVDANGLVRSALIDRAVEASFEFTGTMLTMTVRCHHVSRQRFDCIWSLVGNDRWGTTGRIVGTARVIDTRVQHVLAYDPTATRQSTQWAAGDDRRPASHDAKGWS